MIIDDSIVRGTTLKQSIIRMLDRLNPKKIVVVSSSPQVRYPDCYGIDMSRMGEFIAFKAAIELLKDRGMQSVIDARFLEKWRRCSPLPVLEPRWRLSISQSTVCTEPSHRVRATGISLATILLLVETALSTRLL